MGSEGQIECQKENWKQRERMYAPDSTLMCAGNSKEVVVVVPACVGVKSRGPGQINPGLSLGTISTCSLTLGKSLHFFELWFAFKTGLIIPTLKAKTICIV